LHKKIELETDNVFCILSLILDPLLNITEIRAAATSSLAARISSSSHSKLSTSNSRTQAQAVALP